MLRSLNSLALRANLHLQARGCILAACLNHENTKRLEFHEIFESQISWIILDSMEQNLFMA